jgi:hypothetical protein
VHSRLIIAAEIFDNREIAIGFWVGLFALFAVLYEPTRKILPGLIQAATRPKILSPIFLSALLLSGVVRVLHQWGLWTSEELKDTIIWFLFTGIALVFRGASGQHPDSAIRAIAWDAFRLTVLAEFFFSTYTFSLWVELLLLPFATVVGLAIALAQTEKRYALVAKFFTAVQTALLIVVVAAELWAATRDPRKIFSVEGGRRLVTPIILGFAFVPIAFLMALISWYEQLFLPLKIYEIRKSLALYAKLRLVMRLMFDLKGVAVAKRRLWTSLGKINTKTDVDVLIRGLSVNIPAPMPEGLDKRSYEAGYAFGTAAQSSNLLARMNVYDQCDALVAENNYDQESFYSGFEAGRQDFDLR